MSLALDVATTSTDQTSSPLTWNHTVSGSNTLLVVGVVVTGLTNQPTVSGVTYNSVAMTLARADQALLNTTKTETSIWLLHAPASGTNQVSVTVMGGTTSPHYQGNSVSYTGALQTDVADAGNTTTGSGTGDKTFTVTTVLDNCWIYAVGTTLSAVSSTLAADQTSRGTVSYTNGAGISQVDRWSDTNAAQTPAGAKTVGFTVGGVGGSNWLFTGVSFAPLLGLTGSLLPMFRP